VSARGRGSIDALPSWARDYIGIPFVDKGRDHAGCDCWGLMRLILVEQFEVVIPSFVNDYVSADAGEAIIDIVKDCTTNFEWIKIENDSEQAGDVVHMSGFYRIEGKLRKAGMHTGLVLVSGTLIHVEEGINATLMRYREAGQLSRRVLGFYRYRDLT